MFVGTIKHLDAIDQERLTIEAISLEALTTSEIEGRFWTGPAFNHRFANSLAWLPMTGRWERRSKASQR